MVYVLSSAWMKSSSWNGSDGSATFTPLRPHVGEQGGDDLFVREVVGVVHHLLDLVHVGVDLGVPVHQEADLLGLVAADDFAVGRDDPRVVARVVAEHRAVLHALDRAILGRTDGVAAVEHDLVLHDDAAVPHRRVERFGGCERTVGPVGERRRARRGTTT